MMGIATSPPELTRLPGLVERRVEWARRSMTFQPLPGTVCTQWIGSPGPSLDHDHFSVPQCVEGRRHLTTSGYRARSASGIRKLPQSERVIEIDQDRESCGVIDGAFSTFTEIFVLYTTQASRLLNHEQENQSQES